MELFLCSSTFYDLGPALLTLLAKAVVDQHETSKAFGYQASEKQVSKTITSTSETDVSEGRLDTISG